MVRALVVLAAAVVMGCGCASTKVAQVPPPPASFAQVPPPPAAEPATCPTATIKFPGACNHMVRFPGVGWGTPVSPELILTAAHVVPELFPVMVFVTSTGVQGTAEVLWRDRDRDLAMLKTSTRLDFWVSIAKKAPRPGEIIFWRSLFAKGVTECVFGYALAIDGEDSLIAWGWYHPGTSGSAVLNSRGELVGVTSRGGQWSTDSPTQTPGDVALRLERRTHFPAAMVAVPVTGGIPRGPKS